MSKKIWRAFIMPIRAIIDRVRYFFKYYLIDGKNRKKVSIYFYNWWSNNTKEDWLNHFVIERKIPLKRSLNFFSVFGRRNFVKYYPVKGAKIFYTGEDVYSNAFGAYKGYEDYCLDDVELSLGFDKRGNRKYLHFPFWIFYLVDPSWDYQTLKNYIDKINSIENRGDITRTRFMCQISSHDANGIRTKLVNLFNQIEQVSCAGKLLNNTDELKTVFNDDKQAYLRKFKFNLCPENTSVNGYVTEKCIEAIISGCIPVYWGNESAVIEPEILNQEAILRYTDNNEAELLEKVRALNNSEEAYQAFIEIKPFKDNAAEIIWAKLQQLEKHLTELARG